MLLNDVTFLLDESISKLAEIHERQIQVLDADNTATTNLNGRSEGEAQERGQGLRTLERQCESYLQLAMSTLDMLEYLTSEIVEPFLRAEVVDRLAAMLSYNLVQMVGPKAASLKVRNPEKYHWEPRTVLSLLVGVFLNMTDDDKSREGEAFLYSVARDTRSFNACTFKRAAEILCRHSIRPLSDISRFEKVIIRISELARQVQVNEASIDIPEEFLDPLMFTLMKDPVRLETSKMIVDRATIVAHLLNDSTDPFNRMPLSLDQITPIDDLRRRIEDFLSFQHK